MYVHSFLRGHDPCVILCPAATHRDIGLYGRHAFFRLGPSNLVYLLVMRQYRIEPRLIHEAFIRSSLKSLRSEQNE